MKMEFRDLKRQYERYKDEIDKAINEVILETQFIGGKFVDLFEKRLEEYVGVKHAITCANGTDAMSLIMMAWNIGEGDAVFVPDFTFFSTGEIVSYCGATPIFVDVDSDTFNIDSLKLISAIERVISEEKLIPRVIIPVDLFGLPAEYEKIIEIADKYNLKVLEDAAQSFGGSIKGKKTCSFGDAATTSFFPAKPLGCYGDGGAVFTDDDILAEKLRSLKIHGKGANKYENARIGVNSRLDTIQAAILNVKLDAFIAHELHEVNEVYNQYNQRLEGYVKIPIIPMNYYSSFAQYTIVCKCKLERDRLKIWLEKNCIPCMIYYIKPMHKQEAFQDLKFNENMFDVSNKLSETVLSLPMHPYLKIYEIDKICNLIIEFYDKIYQNE